MARRLAGPVVETEENGAWPWVNEAALVNGRAVALSLSTGYGRRVEKSIALVSISTEHAEPGTALEVGVLGERLAATVVRMLHYDRP